MGRITKLFQRKPSHLLNVYCTAGYPHLDSTLPVMRALQESGADMIELGMPYSDPLADGPVIQASSETALNNGMTIDLLFDQLASLREPPSQGGIGNDMPVILMGYLNPVLQYGIDRFCTRAAAVGIDGIILPDLPPIEFTRHYGAVFQQHALDFIFLVTPETANERVLQLDALSSGFLYAVSSSATTGKDQNMDRVIEYLRKLSTLGLKNPVLCGFGIKDHAGFMKVSEAAAGAIIGSAYIRALQGQVHYEEATKKFIHAILHSD